MSQEKINLKITRSPDFKLIYTTGAFGGLNPMLKGQSGTASFESAPQPGDKQGRYRALPPELVRAIAERVYQMLLRDIKIERERRRVPAGKSQYWKGGR